jgi:tripartite-type tricarboxylate transporter receptor subunit TctC
MKLPRRQFLQLAASAAALPAVPRIAQAEAYPIRPITLIVPFGPGGANDITSRVLARATEKYLGQPFVIENVAGAGGTLGTARAAASRPDGYTLATTVLSVLVAPYMKKASYDPAKDFTFIIGVFEFTFGVVVKSNAQWKTFQEFLSYARASPDRINYATSGFGTLQHIAMEQIGRAQGIKWTHVPYRGEPEAFNALLGGHIDAVASTTSWASLVDSGQLRLLVTWGETRTKRWPTVPTLKEIGIDVTVNAPYGISGPRGMDPNVVKILHDALKKGMEEPSVAETFAKLDEEPFYLSSNTYREFALKQIADKRRVIEELGIKNE